MTQPLPVVDTDPAAHAAPTTAIRIQWVTPPPPEPAAISRGRVRGILAAGVGLGLLLLLVVWVPRLNPALSFPGFGARTPVPTGAECSAVNAARI